MRDFATRAARDPLFVPNDKFPSDEFGEIGRQIIHIFNERAKAMIESEREHPGHNTRHGGTEQHEAQDDKQRQP